MFIVETFYYAILIYQTFIATHSILSIPKLTLLYFDVYTNIFFSDGCCWSTMLIRISTFFRYSNDSKLITCLLVLIWIAFTVSNQMNLKQHSNGGLFLIPGISSISLGFSPNCFHNHINLSILWQQRYYESKTKHTSINTVHYTSYSFCCLRIKRKI